MPPQAWQPFTPRGVAAFGKASATRLLMVQLIVGGLVALSVIWFLSVAWFPVVDEGIRALPASGEVRRATLAWSGPPRVRLAENSRLAFVVDLDRGTNAGHVADVEVTFENSKVTVCTAWRCWEQPYQPGYPFGFNRPELEPAWGARRGPLLALIGVTTILLVYVSWCALAFIYTPLVKLIAFFADRAVSWGGAWRLSAAGLLPGALLVALALVLYGFGAVDLPRFMLLYLLHIVAGLLFVVTSTLFLPKLSEKKGGRNPFSS